MNKPLFNGIAALLAPLGLYTMMPLAMGSYQRSSLRSYMNDPKSRQAHLLNEPEVHGYDKRLESSPIEASDELVISGGNVVKELVIIDESLPDKELFYKQSGPGIEFREISSAQSGLEQLKLILSDYQDLDALHILSHADEGVVYLGNSAIGETSLKEEVNTIAALDRALKDGADLLFYGCNLAKSKEGERFLELLAGEANVNVAGSDDYTGAQRLGGDWDLEISQGDVATVPLFDSIAMADFSDVLAYSGTLALGNMPTGYASTKSYTVPTTSYVFTVKSARGGGNDLYNYSAGYVYIGTNQGGHSQSYVYFSGGETFNLTSLYVYQGFGAPTKTIRVTSDKGGTQDSSSTVAAQSGTTINFSGANWEGITKFTIQYSDGADLHWVKIDNIVLSSLQSATPSITSATYDQSTGNLVVTGTNFEAQAGSANDVTVNKLTLTGEGGGGSAYTLTSATNVEIDSSTQFTVPISGTDKLNIDALLNKDGTTADDGTTYNLAAADDYMANVTSGNTADATNAITVSAAANPTITSATYDFSTGALVVTGTGFVSVSGATNDVDITKLTLTGEGGSTYTLTTSDVDVSSSTSFSVTLNATDQLNANSLLNKNGLSADGGQAYNIAAADNWMAGAASSQNIADSAGTITVSNVTAPVLTSATYDASTGSLVLTGTNFVNYSGATNDLDVSMITLTGDAGGTRTLTSSDVEITSATSATVTLNSADQLAVNGLLNANGTSSGDSTTYNIAVADNWLPGAAASSDIADTTGNAITVSNVSAPSITSATYNASTLTLVVTGTNFVNESGATNDVDVSLFTLTGEGSNSYTLTSSDVEVDSATQFTVTLNSTDGINVNGLLNTNGTTSDDSTTYNLSAADNWMPGANASTDISDTTNGVTVSSVSSPTLTSATYDASTGSLVLTGTNFVKYPGATNDLDVSLITLTGEGSGTRTLTSSDVEITSDTSATVTLNSADQLAVNSLLNANGATSGDGTTYNIAAADNWLPGAAASSNIADTTSNSITVSNVSAPAITSATYNASTLTLVVTGTNFVNESGATNDVDVSLLTITGEGGSSYTLTTSDVEIDSATQFTVTLNATDGININGLLNANGASSDDSTSYNLAAADNWMPGANASTDISDTTNGVTVSSVSSPTLTSATYDASTGSLVLTGTGFVKYPGATNDLDVSLITLTGEGSGTRTLTSSDVEITSDTSATVTLNSADQLAVNSLLNANGTSSGDSTTYNIAVADNWLPGAAASSDISDATSNAITVSNVTAPAITSATYNASTLTLVVTGTNFVNESGATNDVDVSLLTITGEGGSSYTLTSSDVEVSSATSFTVTLNATDGINVNGLLNANGASSDDSTTYNLAAADNWMPGANASTDISDTSGNAVTVSGVSSPTLTSATYDASTGSLVLTGTNLVAYPGAINDLDVSMISLTGDGSNSHTLTSSDVEITSATSATVTLNSADQLAVNGLLNANGTTSGDGTTYNIAVADNWLPGAAASSDISDTSGNGITVSNVSAPAITSATYNASTLTLVVTGTNFVNESGVTNDVAVSTLTVTGEGGSTYTLTSSDVEVTSATEFTVTLNATDGINVNGLLNANGTSSDDSTTYNLAAADNWMPGANASTDISDNSGNAITVSGVASPTLTSATYNASTGSLVLTGTNFVKYPGATNDLDASTITLTGDGANTRTLTSTDVEITSATSATVTLNSADQLAVNGLLNANGTTSGDGTTYNIAVADNWLPGAAASSNIADTSGNAVTVSGVTAPTISSATYNASTLTLVVTGSNFVNESGSTNDVDVSTLTITGEGSNAYTLTSTDVEVTSATEFTVTLNATDGINVNGLLNANGTSSDDSTTYNLAAADNWMPGANANTDITDSSGNGITVSGVSSPTITSATYDASSGVVSVTGTQLVKLPGASNDVDISLFTFTGQGSGTYTITSASDVEITSATAFSFTISGADKSAVDALLNNNGTSSDDSTTYNIAAADNWMAGSASSSNIADLTGNGVTVSNVDSTGPTVSSVSSTTSNGSYKEGEVIAITVTFDETVYVTGSPLLTLETGTTDQNATYSSGSGTSTLTFNYTVQASDTSSDLDYTSTTALSLNGGTLRDLVSNDATLTLASPGAANSLGANKAIVIDTQKPTLAEVTAVTTPGNDTTPNYVFSSDETGTLSVSGSCGTSTSTTISATGNQTITLTQTDNSTALAEGSYSNCAVTVTDAAGNISDSLSITSFTIDTTAPSTAGTPDLDASSDSGSSDTDDITNDTTPTFTGTADANVTVALSSDQDGALGSTTADGSGNWSITLGSALSEATHSITAVASDTAGNDASASSALSVTIDSTAPSAPSAPDLDASSDTGTSDSDDVTNDLTPDLSGSTEANAEISVSSDQDGTIGSATADGTGAWTLTVGSNLTEATHSITYTATDVAGNTSSSSSALSVTMDTTAPSVSSLSPADGSTSVQYNDDLVITFDETVVAGTGNIDVYQSGSPDSLYESTAIGDTNVTISGSAVTLNPNTDFTPTESYYVQVDNTAVEDTAGNVYGGIADSTTWNFTLTNNLPSAANDSATTNEDAAVAVDVLANDSDADSSLNAASVTVTSGPANGSTSVNTGTGVVTYTPDADFNGSDSFTYTVEDVQGGTSSAATVSVTINPVNDDPVASSDMATTAEDNAVTIDVAANDSDIDSGDSVDTSTLAIVSSPSNGSANVVAGEIEYTPNSNFNGSDSFTYTIDDSNGATSNAATVIVNVTSVNDLPTASDDSATTDEDTSVDVSVLDNDSDLDGSLVASTVAIMSSPSNGSTSVNTTTGVITYTPNADYNGSDSFTYVVEDDSNGTSAPATVTITINAVNDAPVAVNDTAVLLEDTAHTINAKGNDSDVDDVNGDLMLAVVSDPTQGSVSVSSGAFVYTPNADFNGSDSFTYELADPSSATSNTATITLTIQSVNDEPIANNDSVQTDEDTALDIAVLDNDSDIDGTLDVTSVAITTSPSQGQVSVGGSGVVTYTPTADYNGSDSFAYTVTDDEGGVSASATVAITINAVNDNPVAADDSASVDEDSSVDISVLDNDSDVDGTIASLAIDTDPSNGTVLVNGDDTVTYTPDTDFNGEDSFTYTVTDDLGGVSTAGTVTITVNSVNDAPEISGTPSTTAAEDSVYTFTAVGSDVDTGDSLTYSITNKPSWASFDTTTGVLSGTPINANVGTTTGIVITVTDSSSANASLASFDLTVINTNDAPVVSGTPVSAAVEGVSYSFNISATDEDIGDMITYVISNNPAWLSINAATGVVTGIPGANDVGTATGILVGANDGTVTVNLSAFGITVVGDLDGDTVGDDVDTDIDGDGMDNTFEESNGLDPRNAGDATSDLDSDGTNNLNEYVAGTDVGADDYPPEITAPDDITVNATGLFTEVDLGTATAVDARDGALTPTSNKGSHFAPGVNTVVWSSTDAAGNSSTDTQVVNVIPMVGFSKNQTVGEDVGTVTLKVILNGDAVSYPVTVPYTIGGSATAVDDHNAVAGVATIDSGRSVSISFDVVNDGVTGEAEETIVFDLGVPTNAVVGPHDTHTVEVIEGNVAPSVTLRSNQTGVATRVVEQGSADVVITAAVTDANVSDTHTYDWSGTDNALTDTDSSDNTFTFTPSSVGLYIIHVNVTDSASPSGSDSAKTTINVIASLPTLDNSDSDGDGVDDLSEGHGDEDSDGIPDYLDHVSASPNTLPEQATEFNEFLIESEPGLKLSLGQVAFNASKNSASVSDTDIANYGNRSGADTDDDFTYAGGRFDFDIDELPVAGQSVNIVIPQFQAIPQNAVYRKLMPSGWRDFVIDENNSVSSTMGSEGFCPPPGDSSYTSGLTEGHWCVQLTVEDGGPNDTDGLADNTVTDPGGVAQLNRVEVEVVGKGGGGSFGLGGLLAIMLFVLHRTRRLTVAPWLPLLIIVPLLSAPTSSHAWYTSGSVGKAAGDETLRDLNQQIANEGFNATATASSDNRTAWKLLVGRSIDEVLSFEVSYVDLGDINVKINGPTLDVQEFFDGIQQEHPSTARGLNLGTRWSYRPTAKMELNGLMGVYIWNAEYDLTSAYGSRSVDANGRCITLGLGLGYKINSQFGARFDVERYVIDQEEIFMWSAGVQYLFN